MAKPTNINSQAEKELDKVEKQFEAYSQNIEEMTLDRMNMAPRLETEPSVKLSSKEIEKSKDIYLKPTKTVACRDKFNESFRKQYEHDKEFVHFQADNKEIIGESIEIWTRPYSGMAAEFWRVPVNKPVWGPRYLAEQIKRCTYHRLISEQSTMTSSDGMGQYTGTIISDKIIPRLEAMPVVQKRSVFMGSSNF